MSIANGSECDVRPSRFKYTTVYLTTKCKKGRTWTVATPLLSSLSPFLRRGLQQCVYKLVSKKSSWCRHNTWSSPKGSCQVSPPAFSVEIALPRPIGESAGVLLLIPRYDTSRHRWVPIPVSIVYSFARSAIACDLICCVKEPTMLSHVVALPYQQIARICVARKPYSMVCLLRNPHNSCVSTTRQEVPRQPFQWLWDMPGGQLTAHFQ